MAVIKDENFKKSKVEDGLKLNTPEDFTSPEILYDKLIQTVKNYHPSDDITMIEKAYNIAYDAHKGQLRKSGEPYIIHPLCVGIILAGLELDKETITAGILHDVVEDTVMTTEEITKEFSEEVALLVDGVTKLSQIAYKQDKVEVQAENLRKMFLAMAKDIRVILIKLADRLHNMRTLKYMRDEKQKEISRETMDIYAPIAHRLGISKIKVELDDLALKYLQPDVYEDLTEKIASKKSEREQFVKEIVEDVGKHVSDAGIKAQIDGRIKHFFSIYKKMVNQGKTIDQIYDLFAIRIIVDTVKDCYAALGVIHEMYKPIPGRFKDYIAMPKPNMYQSLHTTLIGPTGTPFEIQIRTYDMHRTSEYGIAAHWKYKENASRSASLQDREEAKLSWLRQILEWQKEMSDNKEFMELLKSDLDLFSENVYCFTPTGDVKNLINGSTPIDFAYSIHSAVGDKMVGAKVNGRIVTNDYVIKNGDRVEIMTSQNSKGPSLDWLSIVKSTQAKNKINQWFKTELKVDNVDKGKEMAEKYCKSKGLTLGNLLKPGYMNRIMRKYGFKDWDSVYAAIGHGGLKEGQIVNKLIEEHDKVKKKDITDEEILENISDKEIKNTVKHKNGIIVNGLHDLDVRFSKCCGPVPGDNIIGYVTRGRGVSIHRADCINITNLNEEEKVRIIDAKWNVVDNLVSNELYIAEIKIYCHNRTGILVDVSKIFTEKKIDVISMNARTSKQGTTTICVGFEIHGVEELNRVVDKLRNVESVIDIERTTG